MTNSYNLSRKINKIVFFHGLNNNTDCFTPIREHFQKLGFKTEMIVLPCHGEIREEASDWNEAIKVFEKKMETLENEPYYAIAFSHGAVYLNLWMETHSQGRPERQVLLAPALYIRKQKFIEKLLPLLPPKLLIPSLAPRELRRYHILTAREYNILVQKIVEWQRIRDAFRIPTMVLVDPKDELVDAKALKKHLGAELWERPYLKKGLGSHHILFHPDYFTNDDWKRLNSRIETFFR